MAAKSRLQKAAAGTSDVLSSRVTKPIACNLGPESTMESFISTNNLKLWVSTSPAGKTMEVCDCSHRIMEAVNLHQLAEQSVRDRLQCDAAVHLLFASVRGSLQGTLFSKAFFKGFVMLLRVALVGLMLFTAGCSRGEKLNRLPVFKVRGVVTLKGNPIANADITFLNAEANRGAFGKTNEKGEYQLTTYTSFDGAVPGKHSVSIIHTPPVANMPVSVSSEDPAYVPPAIGQSTLPPAPKSNVPAKYADPATSGLIAVVNEDNENVVDFELTE